MTKNDLLLRHPQETSRYRLVSDDDGHDYIIPAEKEYMDKWSKFLRNVDNYDLPSWAKELGTSPSNVTFENYRIGE